jgi:RNA polymerase sigma factor (sigma-70 family)
MDENGWLDARFEEHRAHLRAVAYRMLGSVSEAEDAVQEGWLRLRRADTSDVENMGGWLTTVVARVCLNMLRSRRRHPTEPIDEGHVPDPIVRPPEAAGPVAAAPATDPEQAAVLADSVGLALLVVLETLTPPERLAFVLHDMFAVPFEEIATMLDRTPDAARQLASRARRRVQGAAPPPGADLARQREVVDAFFAAARHGDFEGLVAVLDPDVVLHADAGPADREVVRGAEAVAGRALMFARPQARLHPALINGAVGVVATVGGRPMSILAFTVHDGRVVAIETLADRDRLAALDLTDVLA